MRLPLRLHHSLLSLALTAIMPSRAGAQESPIAASAPLPVVAVPDVSVPMPVTATHLQNASKAIDDARATTQVATQKVSAWCQESGAASGDTNVYLDSIAQRLVPDQVLRTGAMVDYLAVELQRSLCEDAEANALLTRTCAPLEGSEVLVALRGRLVADALGLLPLAQSGLGTKLPSMRVLSAALTALQRGNSARAYLEALLLSASWAKESGTVPDFCAQGEDLVFRVVANADSHLDAALAVVVSALSVAVSARASIEERAAELESAALLALAKLELAEELRKRMLDERARTEGIVAGLRAASEAELKARAERIVGSLSAQRRAALRELARKVATIASAEHATLAQLSNTAFRDELAAYVSLTTNALTVVGAETAQLDGVITSLEQLAQGELTEAVRPWLLMAAATSGEVTVALGSSTLTLDESQLQRLLSQLAIAERFLKAEDNGARWRVVRNSLLGFGAWSDRVILDGHVGAAAVDWATGDYRLALDLSLGYSGEQWGVLADGAMRSFDLTSTGSIETLDYYQGAGELWWASSPSSPVRFDGRLLLGAALYDSDHLLVADNIMYDESSVMGRASLLAGVRADGGWLSAGLWLGAGGQFEMYDSFNLVDGTDDGRQTTGLQLRGRFLARATLWPGVLAMRARAEATRFDITRLQVLWDPNLGTTSQTRTDWSETDVTAQSSLDLEAARFGGFVPGVFVGGHYIRRAANGDVETAWVPILGANLRREWF